MSPSCHIPCKLLVLWVKPWGCVPTGVPAWAPRGLAVAGMGPGLICESGGTQGVQVPGPAWCPQPRVPPESRFPIPP